MNAIVRLLGLILIVELAMVAACYAFAEDLDVTGDVRLRLRYVDSARKSPVQGTYGESLTRGLSYRHRFVLELAYPITGFLRVGGKIRVSNEGEEVLQSGPEYLSSQFGSAFAAYETPAVRSRFGYFDVSYTPLSLMRWDVKDDPEGGGGGCAVCPGTPGVAGAILGESLEELGPALTFEGLSLDLSPWQEAGLGAGGFYTKSGIATETYPVMTYGGRINFVRYLRRASSNLELAALAVVSEEDEKQDEADTAVSDVPFKNAVYGLAWKAPILRRFAFEGEWLQTESQNQTGRRSDIAGYGGIFSLLADIYTRWKIEVSYIYLSPNWDSYFRALSYSHNRRGPRIRLEYGDETYLVAVFAKYMTTIEDTEAYDSEPARTLVYPTASIRGYATPSPRLNLGLAAIYSGEGPEEDGITLSTDNKRMTWLATVTYEIGKDSALTLEERYIQHRFAGEDGYDVSLLSLYLRAAIW